MVSNDYATFVNLVFHNRTWLVGNGNTCQSELMNGYENKVVHLYMYPGIGITIPYTIAHSCLAGLSYKLAPIAYKISSKISYKIFSKVILLMSSVLENNVYTLHMPYVFILCNSMCNIDSFICNFPWNVHDLFSVLSIKHIQLCTSTYVIIVHS